MNIYDRAAPSLVLNSAAANSDVTITRKYYTGSFPITIETVDPGSNGSLSIAKTSGTDGTLAVVITLAYSGSATTTTATQLKAAIDADALLSQLFDVTVDGGSGLVDELAEAALDTPAIETLEVKFGEGNLTWTVATPREYTRNRGVLYGVRNGPEEPLALELGAMYEYIRGTSSTPSLYDALYQKYAATSWSSTDSDACNPYAVDLEFDNRPGACSTREVIIFPQFRPTEFNPDPEAGTISLSGSCNVVHPVIIRFS